MKTIALSHNMINGFKHGDSFNIQKDGEDLHPQFYLEYPFNIPYDKAVKDITFAYYISDIPSEGQEDDINLLNKLEQINDDILTFLDLKEFAEFDVLVSANSITFNEWQGDNCVAIRTDITLRLKRTSNNCLAPFTFINDITI
jgi:hypothetical protein